MVTKLLALIENFALWVACAALLAMGAIVAGSVIGRSAFNHPVPDDLLMIGLLMVAVIVLPLAFIERDDGHIVVTVIADRLPSSVQAALNIFGKLLFAAFLGTMGVVIAKKVPSEFAQNLYYDGQLEIPTWPMKAVFALGVLVFVIRILISVWQILRGADRADGDA